MFWEKYITHSNYAIKLIIREIEQDQSETSKEQEVKNTTAVFKKKKKKKAGSNKLNTTETKLQIK